MMISNAKNSCNKKSIYDFLAYQIFTNPHLAFLMPAKSGFTEDEILILERLNMMEKDTQNFIIDPTSMKGYEDQFGGSDFEPIVTPEQERLIQNMYDANPQIHSSTTDKNFPFDNGKGFTDGFDPEAPWIQTYSGRRFNPTNPNPEAIVIQDIAHALSQQCRFTGHSKEFYSVAQHSVYVSHICNFEDALWGLLHDASEAYLIDVPKPLKKSGKFQAYIDFESQMQKAICKRFGLPEKEPPSVKKADTILLATEARDLMSPRHPDWKQPEEPLPFPILSWSPKEAEQRFIDRFLNLVGCLI